MKFIDLFAGIGGFRSGLEKAGHQCIGYIEWDKFARRSYEAIYDTDGEFTALHMTSKKLRESSYQMQNCGHSEAHAQILALLETELALGEDNPVCFLRLSDSLKKELKTRRRYLPISSWKTLKICYQAMKDGTLPKLSIKWTKSGMISNGMFLIQPKSSLSTGNVSTLSDILEKDVSDKYFLSKDKVKMLLNQQK